MAEVLRIHIAQVKQLPETFAARHFPRRLAESARFRFEADRLRSLGAGALIWYCFGDAEPHIKEGVYGKPYLEHSDRQFNLSHSGDYVVLVQGEEPLGIDIEHCTEKNLAAASRVYTPQELEWMKEQPLSRFEHLWTLKESVMKALGKGFQLEPASFEVLDAIRGGSVEVENVKLYTFTKRIEGYTVSCSAGKPLNSLTIKEITAEKLLKKEK